MIFVSWRFCINFYTWQVIDINIILHLVRKKMEHTRIYAFCFHQKKNAADTQLFVKRMVKML